VSGRQRARAISVGGHTFASAPGDYPGSVPLLLAPVLDRSGQRGVPSPEREGPIHEAVAALGRELLPKGAPRGTLLLIPELVLGPGRPDIAVAVVDQRGWRARARAGVSPLTAPLPLAVACALETAGQGASLAELRRALPRHPRASVAKGLRELARAGWLADPSAERLSLVHQSRPRLLALAAVEAKVDNWRRAARQAVTWVNQVDAAWLAFPAPYLRNVPRRDPYLSRLGLIGVDATERLAVPVRRPRSARARGLRRRISEEQVYARWLAAAP
jgi:hypothetical protein